MSESNIPWGEYFEMTEDGEHIRPEAYDVLSALLEVRGLCQWGWNPAMMQSGVKINLKAEDWKIQDGLEEILPYRKPDDKTGLCSVGVPHEREDCSFSILLSHDCAHVELRKQVFCSTRWAMRMPSIEFALTFLQTIPEEKWDSAEMWSTLFPWSSQEGSVSVVVEKEEPKAIAETEAPVA